MEDLFVCGIGFCLGVVLSNYRFSRQKLHLTLLREENRILKRQVANLKSWASKVLAAQKKIEKKNVEKNDLGGEKSGER